MISLDLMTATKCGTSCPVVWYELSAYTIRHGTSCLLTRCPCPCSSGIVLTKYPGSSNVNLTAYYIVVHKITTLPMSENLCLL